MCPHIVDNIEVWKRHAPASNGSSILFWAECFIGLWSSFNFQFFQFFGWNLHAFFGIHVFIFSVSFPSFLPLYLNRNVSYIFFSLFQWWNMRFSVPSIIWGGAAILESRLVEGYSAFLIFLPVLISAHLKILRLLNGRKEPPDDVFDSKLLWAWSGKR